jgi:hypothetical protein
MTESEWLSCTAPDDMLKAFGKGLSARKMRLFACACCRRIWDRLKDERSRRAVEVAERYADGLVTHADLKRAWNEAAEVGRKRSTNWSAEEAATLAAHPARSCVTGAVRSAAWAVRGEAAAQAALLRDLLGNPFRPVAVDPAWLTWDDGSVVKLARAIYDERRWQDLPVLADALEEVGCGDAAILEHCRRPVEHARGCWLVDLCLGLR